MFRALTHNRQWPKSPTEMGPQFFSVMSFFCVLCSFCDRLDTWVQTKDWKKYSIKYLAVVPFLVRIIQEVHRATFHGVDRLTQQPVFVLESAKKRTYTDKKKKKTQISNVVGFADGLNKPFLVCWSCHLEGLWHRERFSGSAELPSRGSGEPEETASWRKGAEGSCCPGSSGTGSSASRKRQQLSPAPILHSIWNKDRWYIG